MRLLDIGFGSSVAIEKIIGIALMESTPMRRLKSAAKKDRRLIDVTQGRKVRSAIITDSNHVILSGIQAETLKRRFLNIEKDSVAIGKNNE